MEPYKIGTVRDSLMGIFTSLVMFRELPMRDEDVEDDTVELCRRTEGTLNRTANDTMTAIETAPRMISNLRGILEALSFEEST
jgi:argonaute-like protein implicated in RNA metabolism and viral defense